MSMNMRPWTAVLAVLLAGGLAACGGGDGAVSGEESQSSASSPSRPGENSEDTSQLEGVETRNGCTASGSFSGTAIDGRLAFAEDSKFRVFNLDADAGSGEVTFRESDAGRTTYRVNVFDHKLDGDDDLEAGAGVNMTIHGVGTDKTWHANATVYDHVIGFGSDDYKHYSAQSSDGGTWEMAVNGKSARLKATLTSAKIPSKLEVDITVTCTSPRPMPGQ